MASDLSTELLTQIRDGIHTLNSDLNERVGHVERRLDEHVVNTSRAFQVVDTRLANLEEGQREMLEVQRSMIKVQQSLVEGQRSLVEVQQSLVEGQRSLVEGQQSLVVGQKALEEGQKLVVERLDRLVAATTRDRTEQIERLARLEVRVEALESRP